MMCRASRAAADPHALLRGPPLPRRRVAGRREGLPARQLTEGGADLVPRPVGAPWWAPPLKPPLLSRIQADALEFLHAQLATPWLTCLSSVAGIELDEATTIAMQIVPLILFANLFLGIYHNLSIWYKLTDRTSMGMYISFGGALATIGLNLWLIPNIGFMGAAWATLIAYGSMAGVSYVLGRRFYPIPYQEGRLLLYLSVSVGMGWLFIQQIGNLWMGTLMLFVFLLQGLILEKDELKQLFANDHSNRKSI